MLPLFYIYILLICLYLDKQEEKNLIPGFGLAEDWRKVSIAENKLLENLN